MLPVGLGLPPIRAVVTAKESAMAEDSPSITLAEHEDNSEHSAYKIKSAVKDLGHKLNIFKEGGDSMDSVAAILPALMNGGNQNSGTGLGAGVLGGLLGGALLGGNGLGGRAAAAAAIGEGCVTPTQLTAALSGVTDALQNTTVMQTLGDIKASVPLAEGQVQLALAGAQADINNNISTGLQVAIAGQATINKNISDAIAASLASQNNLNQNISAQGTLNLIATKDSQFATQVAVSNSTKEILAALNDQNMANLQRQLTVAETQLAESRSVAREHVNTLTITNTNTNTATAIQAQNQMQAQSQAIIQLAALVQNLSGDIQTVKQGQVIFNSGSMRDSGSQSAANTKVG